MDTSTALPKTLHPNLVLSAKQEQLLFAALNSNKGANIDTSVPASNNFAMAASALTESPLQDPSSGTLGFEESPFIDYDYEFEADGSFDYDFNNDSQGQMIGKLPGTSSDGDADIHDKRSHPDDDDEDEEGGGKRRESDGKGSKKPGRKPLTSEPTSKRKAQNRAAQRAFRERKEKHLKDLETKVDDLEKASESANHENSILRAQIEKMTMELREYRKKVALDKLPTNNGLPSYVGASTVNKPNDVNFQFEFPRFGRLPAPVPTTSVRGSKSGSVSSIQQTPSPLERSQVNLVSQTLQQIPSTNGSGTGLTKTPAQLDNGDMSSLSGLFSPSLLESVSKSPSFDFFAHNGSTGSRSSTDSNRHGSTGHNTSYSSPSASSNSNHGAGSSCGTSPEPTMQSPVYGKASDATLTTIGEENTNGSTTEGNFDNPSFDINGIDWFAQQNGNQFDPQLFGGYREPQENILSGEAAFSDSFFTDAYALPDFNSPFNIAPSPAASRKDLITQIDEKQEEIVPAEDTSTLLSCNTIWDRLQACPKVKDGDFDLDLLCKDLQKKAKCSETGAVVNESDFNSIMKSYVEGNNKL